MRRGVLRIGLDDDLPLATSHRRTLPSGWLAITSHGAAGTMIAVAASVQCCDVTDVERHMRADHGDDGLTVCRTSTCTEASVWLTAADPLRIVASSA